ncbi:MAG TPA: RidA family protein [Candidatus Tectomicrobia bacterium]|jgi:enamine deaminase RidA (YjgF/YER057c/UK114 family)
MHTTLYSSFGHELVAVSGESRPGLPPDEAGRDLFARFNTELHAHGLSLDNTVRTRLWGRSRAARDGGSGERVKVLSGPARSASSSYICPGHFDSEGVVAVDLWAMRGAVQKTVQEYDPPLVPPRYIATGGLVFLSGVTWDKGTLDEQLDDILPRIAGSLQDAGASWAQVVKLSCFLHRSQTVQALRTGILKVLGAEHGKLCSGEAAAAVEYSFVDGYSTPGKLIEIETTAVL